MPESAQSESLLSRANAHRLRALELRKSNHFDEALTELKAAIELVPDYAAAYFNIAAIRCDQGSTAEAVTLWRKAIDLKPDYHQAWTSLGMALRRLGRLDESIAACKEAIRIQPDDLTAHQNLALSLHAARKYPQATAEFEMLLARDPNNPAVLNNFANLLAETNQPARAAHMFQAVLNANPKLTSVLINLGNTLTAMGEAGDAIKCYERILSEQPNLWEVHSNLLLTLNYHPRSDDGLLREHVDWATRHAEKFYPAKSQSFSNNRSSNRRLRIGYVSADFRRHSVSYFLAPILAGHDRKEVEVFCYSNVDRPDDATARLKALADQWRDIAGVSDDTVAEMIRKDQIDILVDLSGHTARHRLLVFARKPAPVQVTYLGYPNTTGLKTIDYRLTDAQADPPGVTDALHTEKLLRLPDGFLCFNPAENAPPILPQTRADALQVRFGSFNFVGKMSLPVLRLWARILDAVPNSTLLLKGEAFGEAEACQGFKSTFVEAGGDPGRLELIPREPSYIKHLSLYQRMDIALDTFPYHGTTTTCEAMFMGVPVVTLAGRVHVSRVGVSLLQRVGLDHLIASSGDEYVAIAKELASNLALRREISGTNLRQRLQASPLMDSARFVRELEKAYRQMWQRWCET